MTTDRRQAADRLQVLYTHPYFWPYVRRGAERGIAELGGSLVERGHRISLLTTAPRGLLDHRTINGIDVSYVRWGAPRVLARRGVNDLTAFAVPASAWLAARSGDLVHTWLYGDAYAATLAKKVRRRPTVLTLTGTLVPERLAELRLDDQCFRRAAEGLDEVWCLSEFAKESMAGFGIEMHVVPFGIDLDRFRPVADRWPEPVLLCTSAPDDPRKRIVDAIDAWPDVVAEVPGATFRIAGAASPDTVERLLGRLPKELQPTVQFLGPLDDDELVEEYSRAWASLSPGMYEALGLTTIEALACGTPVVGVRSGATPELLADGGGALFEPTDPDSCGAAIVETLSRTPAPGHAGACRDVATRHSWERIVPEVEERYVQLLERR